MQKWTHIWQCKFVRCERTERFAINRHNWSRTARIDTSKYHRYPAPSISVVAGCGRWWWFRVFVTCYEMQTRLYLSTLSRSLSLHPRHFSRRQQLPRSPLPAPPLSLSCMQSKCIISHGPPGLHYKPDHSMFPTILIRP